MKLVYFRLTGRYGHFLRAEGGVSALSYPVPPRTAILGLLGAILGLDKDQPQAVLEPAYIALHGRIPQTHWHGAKFRQDPVERLPRTVARKMKAKAGGKIDLPKIIAQEWPLNPDYQVGVSLPEPYLDELEQRLKESRWHFQPCLGLSEMLADLIYLHSHLAIPLPAGTYAVSSLIPQEGVEPDWEQVFAQELVIHSLRLPRMVTPDRVFFHASYFMVHGAGRPAHPREDVPSL